jgi:hypothetical protein
MSKKTTILALCVLAALFVTLSAIAACQPRPEPRAAIAYPLLYEFSGAGLPSPWYPCPIWWNASGGSTSGLGGREPCGRTDQDIKAQAWFVPAAVTVPGDGYLHLTASKRSTAISYGGLTFPYNSGYTITGGYAYNSAIPKQWFTYGYFEARLKCPAMLGGWCAFWMWADPNSSDEIDITETLGNAPNVHNMNLHGAATYSRTSVIANGNYNWHTYAVDWQAGYIKWYLDDVLVATYTGAAFNNKSLYMILSYQLGGDWAGAVDESKLPADMLVDYVRVYLTRPGGGATITPAPATLTPVPPIATNTRTPAGYPTLAPGCWSLPGNGYICIP